MVYSQQKCKWYSLNQDEEHKLSVFGSWEMEIPSHGKFCSSSGLGCRGSFSLLQLVILGLIVYEIIFIAYSYECWKVQWQGRRGLVSSEGPTNTSKMVHFMRLHMIKWKLSRLFCKGTNHSHWGGTYGIQSLVKSTFLNMVTLDVIIWKKELWRRSCLSAFRQQASRIGQTKRGRASFNYDVWKTIIYSIHPIQCF